MSKSVLGRLLFLLVVGSALSVFTGCSEGHSDLAPREKGEHSTSLAEKSQALGGDRRTLGEVRTSITNYLIKRYDFDFCDPSVFRRISIQDARRVLSQIRFPEESEGTVRDFFEGNQSRIVPLLGNVDLGSRKVSLLKLVYLEGVSNVPREMGCSDGVYFDLTSLGIPNPFWSEDPSDPPPSPTACLFTMGNSGPCCNCDAGWTSTEGCYQSFNCPSANCCGSSSFGAGWAPSPLTVVEEHCNDPRVGGLGKWLDSRPLSQLQVGSSL